MTPVLSLQDAFIREQRDAYRKLFDELIEVRKQFGELKALGVRYGLLREADKAKREEGSPLQN